MAFIPLGEDRGVRVTTETRGSVPVRFEQTIFSSVLAAYRSI